MNSLLRLCVHPDKIARGCRALSAGAAIPIPGLDRGFAKGAEETLFRVKDVVLGREKVFDKWQSDLEQVERELIQLDKLLFNV